MLKEFNTPQKATFWTGIVLSVISIMTIVFCSYQMITKSKPWTLGVSYASRLTYSEDQRSIAQVNIRHNKNQYGQAIYELQFNSYTDVDAGGVSGFGIQCVGDWAVFNNSQLDDYNAFKNYGRYVNATKQFNKSKRVNNTTAFGNFYLYYTGDNGVTYYVLPDSGVDDFLLIDINGEFYRLVLKSYEYEVEDTEGFWNSTRAFFGFPKHKTVSTQFTWYEVFDYIMTSAVRNSGTEEYSSYPVSLLDVSPFISIQKQGRNGQYQDVENTNETRNYLTISCDYNKNGAEDVSDSKFKMVASSATWEYNDGTNSKDYWNDYDTIVITEKMLNKIESSFYDGYYLTIDPAYIEALSKQTNCNFKANINLDNLDYKVVGIDMTNFKLKFDEFTISATTKQEFAVLNATNVMPTLIGGLA